MTTPKNGVQRIADERKRQVEKLGWTAEHDHMHSTGDLALVAGCYALATVGVHYEVFPWDAEDDARPCDFPSELTHHERIRLLEKAGALIAAELDRLTGAKP